ncbi:nucleotide exchange factor GrpE [Ornithinimicrobium cryptoxanthini]|uniref:nucleotide exchange factor GrpE n=1 Tax=Ornithinimicrobium cryptoxanthini TaxID=2934161 RepID=UPI0021196B0A|nr:nucleotide exchange factor GrpE [Ornithinimicrobium cryptoxanthini]
MTDTTGAGGPQDHESDGPTGPVIRDKRRIDPETGQVRDVSAEQVPGGDNAFGGGVGDALPGGEQDPSGTPEATSDSPEATPDTPVDGGRSADDLHPDTVVAADRLEDLRRLQAEYVNYKRRVDRDRVRDREAGTTTVVEALLPVLDDLHMAKEHGELTEGPLLAIADKLETTLGRFGVERLGAVGETFDPAVHEALMHLPEADLPEGATETTIVQVMQPGFKVGDRVVRAARVAVADPA